MFHLIFGIVWVCISLIIFFPHIFIAFSDVWSPIVLIFPLAFSSIGIIMIFIGVRKLLINFKTNKNGEICFGKVLSISTTGTVLNGSEEYQAEFLIYVESKKACERITEVIGFNRNKYPLNSLVKVKYYNGDINIISKVYDIYECSYSSQYYLSQDLPLSNYEVDSNPKVNNDDF